MLNKTAEPRRVTVTLIVALATLTACGLADDPASRIERAAEYQANGDYRASMIELKNALLEEPDNVDARIMLGEVSLELGEPAAAESEFHKAERLGAPESRIRGPLGEALLAQGANEAVLSRFQMDADQVADARFEIYLLRGRAYMALGELEKANDEYAQALQIEPESAVATLGFAAVATLDGDTDAAADYIEQVLAKEPDFVKAWLAKGQLGLRIHDYVMAEEAFKTALDTSPASLEIRIGLAGLTEVQLGQNKIDEARRNVEVLFEIAPDDLATRYLKARVAAATGEYDRAERELQQVLSQFPAHTPSKLALGVVSLAKGNLATADSYLSSALAADPGNLEARKLLARIRVIRNQPEDVLDALGPVMQQGQADSQVLSMAARAKIQIGDIDAGTAYLEQVIESDPDNVEAHLQLAASYLLAGRQDDASSLMESLPESGTDRLRIDLLRFLALIQSQDKQGASAVAAKMSSEYAEDTSVPYLIGSAYALAGESATARAYFEESLRIDANNVAALVNLARLDAYEGKLDEAEKRLERFLTDNPRNNTVMVALAHVEELRGDGPAALQWLQRAISVDEEALAPRLLLARHYVATGDFQNAVTLAQELAQSAPDDAVVRQILGLAQMGRGSYQRALQNLSRAVQLQPRSAEALFNLAVCQLALDDAAGAAESLSRLVELQPDNLRALALLTGLKIRNGNLDQAEGLIEEMRVLDADSMLSYTLGGDVMSARSDFAGAARAYGIAAEKGQSRSLAMRLYNARRQGGVGQATAPLDQWLTEYPDDLEIRLVLAQAHQAAGRDVDAQRQYALVLEQDDSNAVALNNLAWLKYARGDSEAVALAARAHNIEPESGAIADTYGWILVQSGEVEDGIEMLRKAVDKEPDIGEIRYHLAVALSRSGEAGEARRLLTELLETNASFESRAEAAELLRSL